MGRSLYFIVNPIAGFRKNKTKLIELIRRFFDDEEITLYQTRGRGDATRAAKSAIAMGYDMVIAVGGDGTVNEVATGLCGANVALGVVPVGSGNGLARSLKIPFDYKKALETIQNGFLAQIDMGKAAHRYFCAVSGIGLDALVGHEFDHTRWRGPLPYFFISAKELMAYSPETCEIDIEGEKIVLKPFLVTIANTRQFGNGAIIAPEAKVDDGYLDLCIVPNLPKLEIISAIPMLFKGTLNFHPKLTYLKIKRVTIRKKTPILFHVDGEPDQTDQQITFEVLPKSLKVCVPNSFKA